MVALAFSLRPFGTSSFRGGAFLFASSPRVSFREEGGRTRGNRGENEDCSGATLVEVMVSVLLLFIIFCSWAAMNNVQAVRKESFRYAAVEKAAGMLDAMDRDSGTVVKIGKIEKVTSLTKDRSYRFSDGQWLIVSDEDELTRLFPESDDVEIGYRVRTKTPEDIAGGDSSWRSGMWAEVELYDDWRRKASKQTPFSRFRMFVKR